MSATSWLVMCGVSLTPRATFNCVNHTVRHHQLIESPALVQNE